jgi:hypothetical protein
MKTVFVIRNFHSKCKIMRRFYLLLLTCNKLTIIINIIITFPQHPALYFSTAHTSSVLLIIWVFKISLKKYTEQSKTKATMTLHYVTSKSRSSSSPKLCNSNQPTNITLIHLLINIHSFNAKQLLRITQFLHTAQQQDFNIFAYTLNITNLHNITLHKPSSKT